ncbi:hypothetical protein CesoFtcFv8_006955 [Champsocephalus esox]|uniref:Uncharacterized protein n=1 Tax=Champsocephalus esox TaxID=159716 RepID=A0AAN8CCH0_9TELE|nr:hypothetical protein CesoFtcFv8_006955 [Champsocephalus esox]
MAPQQEVLEDCSVESGLTRTRGNRVPKINPPEPPGGNVSDGPPKPRDQMPALNSVRVKRGAFWRHAHFA